MSGWPVERWAQDELVSKIRARADQGALNLTPSQEGTSYQGSMAGTHVRDDDAASTRVSMYSYQSDRDNSRFVKEVDGRTINALSDQYYLPTDNPEWDRLDKQHVAVVLALNGLYPAKDVVRAVLSPEEGVTKSILDIGCGTGVWAVEMAKEFPWANVVGVDLALCPLEEENLPPNCRFEVDDVNLGLTHFETQRFDVIHLQFVGSGLKDFPQRLKDVHSCLKPGGIVLWADVDYTLYFTPEFKYLPFAIDLDDEAGSWMQRPLAEMGRACMLSGSDIRGMEDALDTGLWNDEALDPETCKTASLYLPIGPWATHEHPAVVQKLKYIGALMRQDAMNGMRSLRPLFAKVGWPQSTIDQWSKRTEKEQISMRNSPSLRVRLAWGRKRADGEERAPPLPLLPTITGDDEAEPIPYPFLYIYDTPEISMEQKLLRNRGKDVLLPPLPSKTQAT